MSNQPNDDAPQLAPFVTSLLRRLQVIADDDSRHAALVVGFRDSRPPVMIGAQDPDPRDTLLALLQRGGAPIGFISVARQKVQDRTGRWRPVMEIAPLAEYGDNEGVEKFLFGVAREVRAQHFPNAEGETDP